jgi:hypothetical protein
MSSAMAVVLRSREEIDEFISAVSKIKIPLSV